MRKLKIAKEANPTKLNESFDAYLASFTDDNIKEVNKSLECSLVDGTLTINGQGPIPAHLYQDNTNITRIVINNGITSIGEYAFYRCMALTSVIIPNSVTSIGNYAFYKCYALTAVAIPNSVTNIGKGAFGSSGLTAITIPNTITSIGECDFRRCHELTSIIIPNSVTNIGQYAFVRCDALAKITIPNSVTKIGKGAFFECSNLASVHVSWSIPNEVSLGDSVFPNGCTLYVPAAYVDEYKVSEQWVAYFSVERIIRGDVRGLFKLDIIN
jgi:hypothetical protein